VRAAAVRSGRDVHRPAAAALPTAVPTGRDVPDARGARGLRPAATAGLQHGRNELDGDERPADVLPAERDVCGPAAVPAAVSVERGVS
jgi:hypothetical protein